MLQACTEIVVTVFVVIKKQKCMKKPCMHTASRAHCFDYIVSKWQSHPTHNIFNTHFYNKWCAGVLNINKSLYTSSDIREINYIAIVV